jgi:hypothetical protein
MSLWPEPEATPAGGVRSLGASDRGHGTPETARLTHIISILRAVSAKECLNFFRHAGYE